MIKSMLLFLSMASLNANAIPYRFSQKDLVVVSSDGSLIPIETTYNAALDYSKVYRYTNFVNDSFFKFGLDSIVYPIDGEFKLSKDSIDDLEYIKEKIDDAGVLKLFSGVGVFADLLGSTPDPEATFHIATFSWDALGQVISKDIPSIIKSTILSELNMILYKSITRNRPPADTKFWRSMIMAWQYSDLDSLLGTYSGIANNIEMPDVKINVELSISMNSSNSFTGNLSLSVNGRGNAFKINNISISKDDLVQFDNAVYGRKNHFEGTLKDKNLENFCASFNGKKMWCTTLSQK